MLSNEAESVSQVAQPAQDEFAAKTIRPDGETSPIVPVNQLEQDSSLQFTLRANAYNSFAQDAPGTHVNFDNLSQHEAKRHPASISMMVQ
jgi:hypothetical protein